VLCDILAELGNVEGVFRDLGREHAQVVLGASDPELDGTNDGIQIRLEVLGVFLVIVELCLPQEEAQGEQGEGRGDRRPEPKP